VRFILAGREASGIFGTPFGNAGRNSLLGPHFNRLDLATFKNIKLSERLKLQLRLDAQNVLNTPYLGIPDIQVDDATPAFGGTFANEAKSASGVFPRTVMIGARFLF
jgi:hypothetical protein